MPQELATTVGAFSQLQHLHAGLWAAATANALARCDGGGREEAGDSGWAPGDVSALALGLARLGVEPGGTAPPAPMQLLQRLGSGLVAAGRAHTFEPQAVCDLAWAHAAAGVPYCAWRMEGLVLPQLARAGAGATSLSAEGKVQLMLYLRAMQPPGSGMPPKVGQGRQCPRLRLLCAATLREQAQRDSQQPPSQLQREVHAALERLVQQGQLRSAELQQCTPSGLFCVDVAVQLPGGERAAVEVGGHQHFSSNRDAAGRPVAAMAGWALRARLLAADCGWAVVGVPWWEWGALGGDPALEELLLLGLLGRAAVVEGP
jgi:hypothetical protein